MNIYNKAQKITNSLINELYLDSKYLFLYKLLVYNNELKISYHKKSNFNKLTFYFKCILLYPFRFFYKTNNKSLYINYTSCLIENKVDPYYQGLGKNCDIKYIPNNYDYCNVSIAYIAISKLMFKIKNINNKKLINICKMVPSYKKDFLNYLIQYHYYRKYFNKLLQIYNVIYYVDYYPLVYKALIDSNSKHKKTIVIFQQGMFYDLFIYTDKFGKLIKPIKTYFITWNYHFYKIAKTSQIASYILPLGSILLRNKVSSSFFISKKFKYMILITSQWLFSDNYYNITKYLIKKFPEILFIYKPHPAEKKVSRVKKLENIHNNIIITQKSFYRIIGEVDGLISISSTTIIESLYYKTPTIMFNNDYVNNLYEWINSQNFYKVNTLLSLEFVILKILKNGWINNEPPIIKKFNHKELEEYVRGNDE